MTEPAAAPPVATYRFQLTPDAGFDDAAAAVGDLARLGISHLYLSPITEAVAGSTHGYDCVDPTRLRTELGGDEAFARLADACHSHGIGLLVDVVPNHLAADESNPWWWDVLRLGQRSRWADAFDIDWDPPKRELRRTVLLPVLADHYGRELEAGRITVTAGWRDGRVLLVGYGERTFPVSPALTGAVLAAVARRAADDVLAVAARVLARVEDETVDLDARDADLRVAERSAIARLREQAVGEAFAAELADLAADADRLDALLDNQHYRLARWRVGASELVYRRFFDIDALVATRVDRRHVFDAMHALPLRLVRDGVVDGLRIDHVDGLRDPTAYVTRLRDECGPDAWLLVEKIVRTGEDLPDEWPADGTTGYEVADLLGAWLTEPTGAERLVAAWHDWTGDPAPFASVTIESRRLVLDTALAADVERVTDAFVRVCEGRRRHRDHARAALRAAIVEAAIHAPRYRSYVTPDRPASPDDEAFVAATIDGARAAAPELDPELLDLLAALLTGRLRGDAESEMALRFQQLTGPAAAKGEEDTALYRYLALPHRCEVGADPGIASLGADAWHAACATAQRRWPRRLTSLSTHDTKRAADVRARLAVLTTVPDRTLEALAAWWDAAAPHRDHTVDARAGWLVFHTLVGAHPLAAGRAWTAIEKSLREAKLATSWTDPDDAYEAAVRKLVEGAVTDPACGRHVTSLVAGIIDAGWSAALAQLALQLLAPGVPDVYQGGEGWELSLVDPDNRRPVDPAWRRAQLDEPSARVRLLQAAFALRRRHRLEEYAPLDVVGPDAGRVLAYSRGPVAVAASRPGPGAVVDVDARVALPPGRWTDVLAGGTFEHTVDAPGAMPVLLERAA